MWQIQSVESAATGTRIDREPDTSPQTAFPLFLQTRSRPKYPIGWVSLQYLSAPHSTWALCAQPRQSEGERRLVGATIGDASWARRHSNLMREPNRKLGRPPEPVQQASSQAAGTDTTRTTRRGSQVTSRPTGVNVHPGQLGGIR